MLGGVAVFERRLYHLISNIDRLVEAYGMGDPHEIELHGTAMYNGRKEFRPIHRPKREDMIHAALRTTNNTIVRLFAIAVDKQVVSPRDPGR